jgi:origin recognition complex subunit 4
MVESRAAKRRRVSEAVDRDGDIKIPSEVPETPPSDPDGDDPIAMDIDDPEVDAALAATPSNSARRRSTAAAKVLDAEENETPSRSVRASGRQRKAPVRYEDEIPTNDTPRRSKISTIETPSKTPRSVNGLHRTRKSATTEAEVSDGRSPEVDVPLSRRRSRRSTKKVTRKECESESGSDAEDNDQELGLINGGMDDTYDPVAAQLQEDLVQDADAYEETVYIVPLPDYAETFQKICASEFQEEVGTLGRLVLEKLSGKRLTPLKSLDAEYQKVYQLVEQTVTAGEGNSMLLMGSRGSGKTTMVESIVSSLSKDHKDDFHVVRLNGFFHTDDRLALREIWRQLGRERDTEDEASKINSYADTMATLLALLSHPEELLNNADNSNGITTAKSVVIILDEFDLFATHPRQTLLYNLFDIAQARKAPLAVLGLTTKVDVTETLEKRVKSRFSHRYVYLPLAKTFESFSEACLSGLTVENAEIQEIEFPDIKPGKFLRLLDYWRIYLKVISRVTYHIHNFHAN